MENREQWLGSERRDYLRLEYGAPLAYKVCKQETLSQLLEGYTVNVSEAGLLCTLDVKVEKDDILWLSFDRSMLTSCEAMEKRCLIYQKGIIGKVVRVEEAQGVQNKIVYHVGIQFITREEKNFSHIYPQVHFFKDSESAP
jgi:hypothetical protein